MRISLQLSKKYHTTTNKTTHSGCELKIPNFSANTPVMNGRTAGPTCPTPAIHPMAAGSIQRGRTRLAWFMVIGKRGPRRAPTRATATALPKREGMSHTTSSSLDCGRREERMLGR